MKQQYLILPEVLQIIPMSRTKWYEGIKRGVFPPPIKFGRSSLWKREDIEMLIETLSKGGIAPFHDERSRNFTEYNAKSKEKHMMASMERHIEQAQRLHNKLVKRVNNKQSAIAR